MQTKSRSKQRRALVAFAALLLVNVIAIVAFTRSTTPPAPSSPLAGTIVVPPENEAAEHAAGRASPDEYLDLKQSSASPVSEAQVERAQAQAAEVAPAANGIAWQQLGPYNVGGRVVDVQADKETANGVYAAVSGGGVWHSADGGTTWSTVWPDAQTQTMGALAQDGSGTLWAGTGEANPPGGGLTYFGDGIYKSTDDGAHWTNMGLRESASIGRIAIDPSNANRVFAAASGHVARSAGQRGLYRTSDGGQSWQLVLAPINATTGAIDVAINPANPQIVYAAMWDHKRNNGARVYGGVGSGLFRSKDGGDTWERLQNIVDPLPAYDQTQTGLKQDASLGRIGVTIAPSDPEPRLRRLGLAVRPGQGLLLLRRRRRQLPRRRPRLPDLERLPVVVRAPLGRPEGQEPHLQRGRQPAHVDRRRHDVDRDQRAALRPARDGLGPASGQPRLPRQRRRHVPLRQQRRQRLMGEGARTSRGTSPTTSPSRSRTRSG